METDNLIFAVVTALITLASGFIAFFSNRKQAAETASDRLIDQMQEQIRDLRLQVDADRERYIEEIKRLRELIEDERRARMSTEDAAARMRETYERQLGDLRAQLEQATISRNDRMAHIEKLQAELNLLRGKVGNLEKRNTGELKE